MIFTLEMVVVALVTVILFSNSIFKHNVFVRCYYCCYRQCNIVYYTLLQQMPWTLHLHVVCC